VVFKDFLCFTICITYFCSFGAMNELPIIRQFTLQQLDSFRWRIWNTFKVSVLPIALPIIIADLQTTGSLRALISTTLWHTVAYTVVISLLIGLLAGLEKVSRMKQDHNEEEEE
jgi:hypothetical protein